MFQGIPSPRIGLWLIFAFPIVFASSVAQAQEEEIAIPMSTYQDLLNRMDSVESRVAQNGRNVASARARMNGARELESGYYGAYEYAILAPVYSNSTAFYTHDTVIGSPESATLTEFDWEMEGSHRFELGYLSPSTQLGWRARYWFFDAGASENSADDVDVKVGVADDPDIAIDTLSSTDPDFLAASASTEIDVVDLEGFSKRSIYNSLVTFSAGLRYANIQHNYIGRDVDPTLAGPNNVQTALLTDFNFEGIGPTFSLGSQRRLGCSFLSWNASGRASLLFGQGDGLWERFGDSGSGTPLVLGDAIVHNNETRIVPVGELRLGLDYKRNRGKLLMEFGTGLESQVWLNGGTPLRAGQDGATDSDGITSPWTEDLGFIGLYLRAGARY
ncbi:MAG: Lpg1974 family pore-forming outer membrane protein [Planctomycetota bacterium]